MAYYEKHLKGEDIFYYEEEEEATNIRFTSFNSSTSNLINIGK